MWRSGSRSSRVISAATLIAFTLGCTSWKTQQPAPDEVLAHKRPDHVRVLRPGEAELELWAPRLSGDSLVGRLDRKDSTRLAGVPLSDATRLQVRELNAAGWLAVVVGVVGVSALLIATVVSMDGFFQDGS